MKYNEIKSTKRLKTRRVGRGISGGKGKTAGRGTKGQGSRKSGGVRPGFEGGRTPLSNRIPKLRSVAKGSHARSTKQPKAQNVYTGQLDSIRKSTIDNQAVFEAGLTTSPYVKVKLLLEGELKAKKDIRIQAVSNTAAKAVEKAGGSFTAVPRIPRPKKKSE